jgi:hypothetical protein
MNCRMFSAVLLLIALIMLISRCAKMSAPTGGPRDRLPPVVVKSVPVNGTVNFREKSLSVTFDEYVVLDNINDKFMVSPPMKKKPRVFIKGKSVNVEFNEELKDSTTYTLYFQDAIKDLNEGNIIDNFQLVFSTGPVIDSLSVTGNVYLAINLEVPEKTLAVMYRDLADSAVKKHLPDYISNVDQDGYFRIDNIRAGTYRLYALKDADNSKNYNLEDEEFAFMDSTIKVTPEKSFIPVVKDTTTQKKIEKKVTATTVSNSDKKGSVSPISNSDKKVPVPPVLKSEYRLMLFAGPKKNHYLTSSSRTAKYQLIYSLSLPPDSMKFRFSITGVDTNKYLIERSRNNDTLKVWLTDSTLYSQPQISTIVNYPFTDTLGIVGYKEDTIIMRYIAPRAPRVVKVKRLAYKVETNISSGFLKPGQIITLEAQTPFLKPDTSRIRLYELADTIRKKIPFSFIKDSTNSCKYSVKSDLKPGKKYLYIADSASFSNIYREYSDSTGIRFSVKDPDSYSTLTLNISNYEGVRIIQLLNNTEKVLSEVIMEKNGKLVFPLLETGFYRVRVIYDLNNDRKWTTGDFASGRLPEPVSYYPAEIEIKPGWNVDQDWDMGVKNFKDQKLRQKKKGKL